MDSNTLATLERAARNGTLDRQASLHPTWHHVAGELKRARTQHERDAAIRRNTSAARALAEAVR